MTTTLVEDLKLGSALAILWQRHRQTNLDRISLLEMTTANVLRSVIDDASIAEGVSAAHKLAGSLGTFGFDAGSRAALEAESLLREPIIDGRLLAESVTALRTSVEEVGDTSDAVPRTTTTRITASTKGSAIRIVSCDAELLSRLTVEAATIGLVVTSVPKLPMAGALTANLPSLIIVDAAGPWTRSYMLKSVAAMARVVAVVVLTDTDSFEERLELATAGAAGVISRAQGPRQMLSFVSEEISRRRETQSSVLALNISGALLRTLGDAITGLGCSLEVLDDPGTFWAALEARGADLVVLGLAGPSSGSDVCRVIRTHPHWKRLPVLIVGETSLPCLEDAMNARADDYLNITAAPQDLGIRIRAHLARGRSDYELCNIDPFTGAENRASAERSFDRLLRISSRRNDPLAIAVVTIDRYDQIRETEGNAMGEVVLRRLGTQLRACLRGEDIVGRWTHDGFAVGLYGSPSEPAFERITEVITSFGAETFSTTSGTLAKYTASAGIASAPVDGSRLFSLVQLCETAVRRARTGQNRVVVAGERPASDVRNVVDVVLVEDDDTVADVIEHALGLRQYSFVRFADGAEAARELSDGSVRGRVVLLDVGLPSLDGFGVLRTLRNQGVLDETRVIMLTARSSEPEMLRALGLGATEHITKPFSVPVLLGRLGQTLVRSTP
jgi:diguanylate cyclase (GGDEF)-like protein